MTTGPNPNRTGPASPQRSRQDPFDGALLVDKPSDWTSHDVVAKVRNHFRFRKVGHGGTLDPMATGLLILLIGRGTKLSQLVMGSDKTYEGVMQLGAATDTQDRDGKIISEKDFSYVTKDDVEREMNARTGDIMQTPPMVSAVKRDGVPLYKLARKGQTVERKPRLIHLYHFTLLEFSPPEISFRLKCTKGTYVRTLCSDIGDALGCGAHLKELRRTQSGGFTIDQAHTLEELLPLEVDALEEYVISPRVVQQQESSIE
ncbi:MAG: tRNA pseudouridine(55) synthase TruB [Verrucomicrobia bacterium]|nr:tRNA pseudouridine(55) synthase TruB [Verrucomicrobiota bacterium]